MFWNYFLISYRRHKCFLPFLYIYLPNEDVSIFLTKLFWCIFKQGERNHLHSGSNIANTLLLRRQNRSCDEHKTPKQINSHFFRCLLQNIRKKSTGRRSNGSTSHFVLCETKPNNLAILCMNLFMLCMIVCICCAWKFVYVMYDIFWLLFFVYIVYYIKSDLIISLLYNIFNILH